MAAFLHQIGAQVAAQAVARPSGARQVELNVTANGSPLTLQVTTWVRRNSAITVFAYGEPAAYDRGADRLVAITTSMAPLTPDQRRQAVPDGLHIHQVLAGEDFAGLARRYPGDARDGSWLSYFNGYDGNPKPRAGDLVKIVTATDR